MEIIVGTIVLKDNKILMIREAKKDCYKKWSFPAGHLEKNETTEEGAKRETFEESGCKVELKKLISIFIKNTQKVNAMIIYYLADLIDEDVIYKTDEILEKKWLSIDEIKKMNKDDIRNYDIVEQIIKNIELRKTYSLEIINNI